VKITSASREGVIGGIRLRPTNFPHVKKLRETTMVPDKNVYHAPHGPDEFLRDYSTSNAAPPTMAATARLMASCEAPLDAPGV